MLMCASNKIYNKNDRKHTEKTNQCKTKEQVRSYKTCLDVGEFLLFLC